MSAAGDLHRTLEEQIVENYFAADKIVFGYGRRAGWGGLLNPDVLPDTKNSYVFSKRYRDETSTTAQEFGGLGCCRALTAA